MFKWIACTILPCVFLLTAVAAQSQEIDRTIHVTDSPLPERFSKGLPATVADLNNWWHGAIDAPPIGHATAMILDGDEDYLGRFIAAAEAVPAAEATQWAKLFSDMLRFKVVDEQSCNRVRRIMAGESSTARVAIARLFVDSCSVTSDLALVERPDTPWWAVLAQYDRYRRSQWKDATYTSRLGQAARQAFDAGEDGWRQAALTLADLSSPEADRELLSIHAGISDQELADQVALFFRTSMKTEAQARF